MASKQKTRLQVMNAIEGMRAKHERLLDKVHATRAKLEKRSRKLRALEAKIAGLEQRAYGRRVADGEQPPADDSELRPARLIFNPKSGKKHKRLLETLIDCLRTHGIRPEIDIKSSGKGAREMAQAAVDSGETLVIVAGGDSTVEEVAPALIGSNSALGILPVGTMNNVARSLGIPLELNDACALLAAGSTRQIDIGHVISDRKQTVDYFLETAGLGLIAIAFSAGKAIQKGPLAGLPRALSKFFDHKPGAVKVELDDGQTIVAKSQIVTASNAPLMGLNFLIAPQARMDDGLLDIAVYDDMGKAQLVEHFVTMRNGKHADNPHVRFFRSRKVRIESSEPLPIDSDKNPLPEQNVLEIEVLPQAVKMVVGKGIGLNLPVDAVQSTPPLSGTK